MSELFPPNRELLNDNQSPQEEIESLSAHDRIRALELYTFWVNLQKNKQTFNQPVDEQYQQEFEKRSSLESLLRLWDEALPISWQGERSSETLRQMEQGFLVLGKIIVERYPTLFEAT